jgi:hypothetical protein
VRRRGRNVASALGIVLAGLCFLSASASAVQLHGLEFSFDGTGSSAGAFSDLGAVAVHQGTGTVYAIDRADGVVDKFDASGNPQNFSALGSSSLDVEATCPGFVFPPLGGYYHGRDDIAVDSSGGPTDGNIYVATDSAEPGSPPEISPGVCAYDSAGNFLWKTDGSAGVTTDAAGHLWATHYGQGAFEYDNEGSPPEVIAVIPEFGGDRIGVDSHENVYMAGRRYTFLGYQETVQSAPLVAVDPDTDHLYLSAGNQFNEYASTQILGGGLAWHSVSQDNGLEILQGAEGIAVSGSTGKVYVADHPASKILVFSALKDFATVSTDAATNLRRTTATVRGHLDPDGGGNITGCHFEYGTDKTYGSSAPCAQATPYSTPIDVDASLAGLQGGMTYHYRLFATDASGVNKGQDKTFTTPFVSDVNTGAASSVSRTSATLNGSLDPDGLASSYYFEWGHTEGYGNTTPIGPPGEDVGSAPGATPVSAALTSLDVESVYHYRIVAVNGTGSTAGPDRSFETDPAIKDLQTADASAVTPDTATLNASLDPDGFDTHYYFEWGETTAYGSVTPALPGGDAGLLAGTTPVTADVQDLDPYTVYHYRVVATNSFGETVGQDVEFRSEPPFLPEVGETIAMNVTDSGATLVATLNPGLGPTAYRFQYGETLSYGRRTPLIGSIGEDGELHQVMANVGGLLAGTTYHYRVVGINFSGTTLGPDKTFTTSALPGIASVSAVGTSSTSATLSARVTPGSSATTVHFEYGLDQSYGSSTPESGSIGSDTTAHEVSANVSGLVPGSTYHFRVVATNKLGTVRSGDGTFATPPRPAEKPIVKSCKRGFRRRGQRCVRRHHHRHNKENRRSHATERGIGAVK